MSVSYEICEHLSIHGSGKTAGTVKMTTVKKMSDRLEKLRAMMLAGDAEIYRMDLTVDGKRVDFKENCIGEEYKNLLSNSTSAPEVEFHAHYQYVWRAANEDSAEKFELFALASFLESLSDDECSGIFYSIWNNADCESGAGVLLAYGKQNGKLYKGAVEFETVSAPDDGEWYAETDITVDSEYSPEQSDEVIRICKELNSLTLNKKETDYLSVDGNTVAYYMNDVLLKGEADYQKLVRLYTELRQMGQQVWSIGEYADVSGADAQVMHISFNDAGVPTVKIAAIK